MIRLNLFKSLATEKSGHLFHSNPSLRVAYIDEVEERDGDKVQKVYYSVLVKAVDNLDQVRAPKSMKNIISTLLY